MSNFNINLKRKELRRKVRRRKLISASLFIIFIFISLIITVTLLRKDEIYINNKLVASSNYEKKVICIDPGHGDWDSGSIGYTNSLEKDIVLEISLLLGDLLEKNAEFKVVYTRINDSLPNVKTANESLKERLKVSERFKADIFISIHCNSDSESKDINGIETWYNPEIEESLILSTLIQEKLVNLNYSSDRGLKNHTDKDEAFAVLEKNSAIPTLVELGFLSNYFDERFLVSESGQSFVAEALYEAIIEYYSLNPSKEEINTFQ